jgi:hypothetical protein
VFVALLFGFGLGERGEKSSGTFKSAFIRSTNTFKSAFNKRRLIT